MAKGEKFLKYDPKSGEALVAMPKNPAKVTAKLGSQSLSSIMVYFMRCRYRLDFFSPNSINETK